MNPSETRTRRPVPRVWASLTSQPWAIREESLREILLIAARANPSPESVAAELGRPLASTRTVTVRDGVAIVPLVGPVFPRANLLTEISGATSVDTFIAEFHTALRDTNVHAILLDIDSPGGQVAGVGEAAGLIREARSGAKPIIAHVSSLGASAAYWIASAASEIVAAPSALIGSIGVIASYVDTTKQDQMLGIEEIEILSSHAPHKVSDPRTDEGRARIQTIIDDTEAIFVADVAAGRGVSIETVMATYGRGDILIASKAKTAGMIDQIDSLESTIRDLAARRTATSVSFAAHKGGHSMSWKNNVLRALYGGDDDPEPIPDGPQTPPDPPTPTPPTPNPTPTRPAPVPQAEAGFAHRRQAVVDPELAALRQELERERSAREEDRRTALVARLESQATSFAAAAKIGGNPATPDARSKLAAAHLLAAQADAGLPIDGAALTAAFEAAFTAVAEAPQVDFTTATAATTHAVTESASTTADSNGTITPQRRRELLTLTPEGREILARERPVSHANGTHG